MKITKSQLRQIIKEEILRENEDNLVQQLIRTAVRSLRDKGYFGSELRGMIFHEIDELSKNNPKRGQDAKDYINQFGIPGNL